MEGIGEKIREARRKKGLTAQQLAYRAGLSLWTIHRLETGKTQKPEAETLSRLLAILGKNLVVDES